MENKEYFQKQYDKKNLAVLLVNFGGPMFLKEVKPFLYNLFSDPMVLNLPLFGRPLAWLIANLRDKTSKDMYKRIGGKTPLVPIAYLQAQKLQEFLHKNHLQINVFIGFRYSKPYIEDALCDIYNKGYKKVVLVPLYPQYSFATTGSAWFLIKQWIKSNEKNNIELQFINSWYKDDDFINAHANLIQKSLSRMDLRQTEIIFSAHSVPASNIQKGDPYQREIENTVKAIIEKLKWKKRWHIGYQSKIGPIKWLGPSTDTVIKEIAKRNPRTNLVVVPISFTSEHVETIFEIDKVYKKTAAKHGIKNFCRTPALNTDNFLIQALYNQVLCALTSNEENVCKTLFSLK